MKTLYIFTMLCAGLCAAMADEVKLILTGGGMSETVIVTTNEVQFAGLCWDGHDGGGSEQSSVVRKGDKIIFTKTVITATGMTNSLPGIEHETVSRTVIPVQHLPYTFVDGTTTCTVSKVEQPKKLKE